jgi:hypothetical protein
MRKSILTATVTLAAALQFLNAQEPAMIHMRNLQAVSFVDEAQIGYVVNTDQIYLEGLDTVPQVRFWRNIMTLSPDSGLLSMQGTRTVFAKWSNAEWNKKTETEQNAYRDSLRKAHNLADSVRIFYTVGKNDFYNPHIVLEDIHKAVPIFMQEGVDPFYAQAILLIESPGKVRKSNAGAVGAFQLMPGVARSMGLKVGKKIDERKDFFKSAWASSKLIRTICVPQVNSMLSKRGIACDSTELWYRLLVLHVYHAGAGNVDAALNVINPTTGGMWLVKQLWVTKAAQFGNASQNYSQLAVSAMIELDYALCKWDGKEVCRKPGTSQY